MPDRETLRHHAELLDRMAQRLSVDLEEAVLRGEMRPDSIADAVLRCADCPNPDHCAAMLTQPAVGPARAPGYCRNRRELERLGDAGGR